jgi:glycosyltransferase involved in cell wall biosynthesis
MPTKKTMYLMVNEDIVDNAIFESQVISLLERIAATSKTRFLLLVFVPLLRVFRWGIQSPYRSQAAGIRKRATAMQKAGIELTIVPTAAVSPFVYFDVITLPVALLSTTLLGLIVQRRSDAEILHARNYLSGLTAWSLSKLTGVPYVFDPRGLYPEETVNKKRWAPNGPSYRLWKWIEERLLQDADVTISVSDPMTEHLRDLAPTARVRTINPSVELHDSADDAWQISTTGQQLLADLDQLKASGREILVFAGRVNSAGHAYDLDYILNRYTQIRPFFSEPYLLLLSRRPVKDSTQQFQKHGLYAVDRAFVSLTSADVPWVLGLCDYGLLFRMESSISFSEMSIKLAEYLAAGLPVIADAHIGGAARIIVREGVGVLVDDASPPSREIQALRNDRDRVSERCKDVARRHFDITKHAQQYVQIYHDVTG